MIGLLLLTAALVVGGQAIALELKGPFTQGALITGKVSPGSSVLLDGVSLSTLPDGSFVFGLARDAKPKALLSVQGKDGNVAQRTLKIRKRNYKIQRIDGLPKRKVSPKKRDYKRIAREQKLLNVARYRITRVVDFKNGFVWPARGRISGVHGSQRILNGKPKRPHNGVDIAAHTGTIIRAPAPGVVALVHPDMFYTGKSVMLDHGHGLTSVYMHLNSVTVKVGQFVRQGEQIGTVGKTGRASGPHLDWRLNWFNQRLDPGLLLGPKPK